MKAGDAQLLRPVPIIPAKAIEERLLEVITADKR